MVRRTPRPMSPRPPQVITAGDYQVSLRRFVLSTGVGRIMEATEASRSTVYRWISRSAPGMPSEAHRQRLDEMMRGVRRNLALKRAQPGTSSPIPRTS